MGNNDNLVELPLFISFLQSGGCSAFARRVVFVYDHLHWQQRSGLPVNSRAYLEQLSPRRLSTYVGKTP